MSENSLEQLIDHAWEDRDNISPDTKGELRDAIDAALEGLDSGTFRVAEKNSDGWTVNQWLKKAVLLSFRIFDMTPLPGLSLIHI